jgi:hypothetical protein
LRNGCMLAGMNGYLPRAPRLDPSLQRRQAGKTLGNVGRILGITAAVVLVVGGLAMIGIMIAFVLIINSLGSNK